MAKAPAYLSGGVVIGTLIHSGQALIQAIADGITDSGAAFPDTATLTRTSVVDDGLGGVTAGAVSTFTFPCNLYKAKTFAETTQAGELKAMTVWLCAFPVGTDLRAPDVLTIKGDTYQVSDVDRGRTNATELVAQLVRLETA